MTLMRFLVSQRGCKLCCLGDYYVDNLSRREIAVTYIGHEEVPRKRHWVQALGHLPVLVRGST